MKDVKVYLLIILLTLILGALAGCGGGKNSNPEIPQGNIQLSLSGFPRDAMWEKIVVCTYNKANELINKLEYKYTGTTEFKQQIAISQTTTLIMVYLFKYDLNYPSYLYGFPYLATEQNYQTCYWLDYNEYQNDRVKFGVSEALARTTSYDFTETQNFKEVPYYLYKMTNVGNMSLNAIASASGGRIGVKCATTIKDFEDDRSDAGTEINRYITSAFDAMYLLVKPDDYGLLPTSFTITVKGRKALPTKDYLTNLIAGDSPDIVYGLSDSKTTLYYIHPVSQTAESYLLPESYQAAGWYYSKNSNKLYIAAEKEISYYVHYKYILEWDCNQKSIVRTTQLKSERDSESINDIIVDEINNRIYVLYKDFLDIHDRNSYELISSVKINLGLYGKSMCLAANGEKLLITGSSSIIEYSVDNGQNVVKTREILNNFFLVNKKIAKSPVGSKIACWSGSGVNIMNADEINQVICSYPIAQKPLASAFSPDGQIVYFFGQDNYIYLVDTNSGVLIKKISCPAGRDDTYDPPILSTNSNGQVLICARYESQYSGGSHWDVGRLYFYKDITDITATKALKTGFSLQKMLFKELIPWEEKGKK